MQKQVRKAVIPVAGLGTRGLPFTKVVPKELTPIIETPTIHFIVEEVLSAGIEQIVFVTAEGKESLEAYFKPSPHLENWLEKRGKSELAKKMRAIGDMAEIISIRQNEPLGLGHAILCAQPAIGEEPFAVCLGDEIYPPWIEGKADNPTLQDLVSSAIDLQASMVGVVKIPPADTKSYGIIDTGGAEVEKVPIRVRKTVEKPAAEDAPSLFAIIGRYIFRPELFGYLKDTRPGVGGEIQLTDAMNELAKDEGLYALQIPYVRYDVGNQFSYLKAVIDAGLRRPEIRERLINFMSQRCLK